MKKIRVREAKAKLRRDFLYRRKAIPEDESRVKAQSILENLQGLEDFKTANVIHSFVSIPQKGEVDTHKLIRDALNRGARVVVPITDLKKRVLCHSEIKDFSDLEVGTFGVLEPKKECVRPVDPEELDIVIVPGLAFDRKGNRLGYGGGFYDGFLKDLSVPKIALAYEWQVIEDVPAHESDVKVDKIVTEKGIYDCRHSKLL